MDEGVKKLWADALESGEYPQAKERLRSEKGFCCLGVLCDLYAKEAGVEWEVNVGANGSRYYTFENQVGLLPRSVATWAGLESPAGDVSVSIMAEGEEDVRDHSPRSSLTSLNDRQNRDFKYIANVIRTKELRGF